MVSQHDAEIRRGEHGDVASTFMGQGHAIRIALGDTLHDPQQLCRASHNFLQALTVLQDRP